MPPQPLPAPAPPPPQQQNNKWADRKNGGFDGPLCGETSQGEEYGRMRRNRELSISVNQKSNASKVQSQIPQQSSSTNKDDEDVDEVRMIEWNRQEGNILFSKLLQGSH